MLSEKEKLAQRDEYVNSVFGKDTFHTLFTFRHNSLGFLSTVGFIGNLIEKIDDKKIFPTKLSDSELIEIKQYLTIEVISKIIVIIEGLFVLTHSLSIDYKTTTNNMINYSNKLIWQIIDNFKQKKYDYEKIFALPLMDELPLTNDEKISLMEIYKKSSEGIHEIFEEFVKFYEKYNILYNKNKHGFTLVPGAFLKNSEVKFENSSLSAFDHKDKEEHMPPMFHPVTIQKDSDITWFNVESRINFNKKTFGEIGMMINQLEIICATIVDNHLNLANNCGQNYLPVHENEPGKYSISFLTKGSWNENEIKLFEVLNQKILKDMTVNPVTYNMKRSYTKKELIDVLDTDSIINIFLRTKETK